MSTTEILAPDAEDSAQPPPEPTARRRRPALGIGLHALVMRLHFYAGVFVAPFVLIAAVTGALYAISPTLERIVSHDLLKVEATGPQRPLSEQVASAVATLPDLDLVAVAPAPEADDTTRVIFGDPTLGASERRAVFVDPYTARPVGEAVVYGSSGALPLRTWIDRLHRDLHLGETGRLYTELAASWLWVIAMAGLVLWIRRVRGRRARDSAGRLFVPDLSARGRGRTVNWHGVIGIWVLPVVLLLSATGMTWSTYAGANIGDLRTQLSWTTPSVSAELPGSPTSAATPTGDHHTGHDAAPRSADPKAQIAQLDGVYNAARGAGVTHGAEITIPSTADQAFTVKERRMPGTYTVNSAAVDGSTGAVTDRLAFADWPLMAKLTNWGIQFHMGLMFGLLNQLLLLVAMIGLIVAIVLGYRMWWQRRPRRGASRFTPGPAPRRGALRASGPWAAAPLVLAALVIGWFVPLVGLSLLAFLVIDVIVGLIRRLRTPSSTASA